MSLDPRKRRFRRAAERSSETTPSASRSADTSAPLERGDSIIDRASTAFQTSLERNRGGLHRNNTMVAAGGADSSISKSSASSSRRGGGGLRNDRVVVPEGVVIEGSLNAESDAEISGRVLGNVMVGRKLRLGPSGMIVGNVRCQFGQIEGTIEGKTECKESLDLGPTGLLKSDVMSGSGSVLAGEVQGDVKCGGTLRLTATAVMTGNVRARAIAMDEGAKFNGLCSTRNPKSDGPSA